MAVMEGGNVDLTLRRGETRDYVFYFGPRDMTLQRFNLTGKAIEMRITPKGGSEIVYSAVNPGCYLSNAAAGEITINPSGAMKAAYTFQNAPYYVTLDGKRLFHGSITVQSLNE